MSNNVLKELSIPLSIIVAGAIIGLAIYFTNTNGNNNTQVLGTSESTESKYQKYVDLATDINLDGGKFEECMLENDTSEIKADLSYASSIGANGTPAFFVGKSTDTNEIEGVRISGALPYETFVEVIEGLASNDNARVVNALAVTVPEGQPAPVFDDYLQLVSLDDDPVKGSSDAPITIVEFSDYECPFCQRHFQSTYSDLDRNYISQGKVKYVFRDLPLPFHDPVATEAALAANCARKQGGDEAYFSYHDEYFLNTKANGEGL